MYDSAHHLCLITNLLCRSRGYSRFSRLPQLEEGVEEGRAVGREGGRNGEGEGGRNGEGEGGGKEGEGGRKGGGRDGHYKEFKGKNFWLPMTS